jgi:hypothetical protein
MQTGLPTAKPSFFLESVVKAFPLSCKTLAESAGRTLSSFVDESYKQPSMPLFVLGQRVLIPKRIHFQGLANSKVELPKKLSPTALCLCTRSTDGHVRQAALRRILLVNEPWAIPFVVLLAGEYVVEIIADMVESLSTLSHPLYVNFVHENRPVMRVLRARTISYWDSYCRSSFPERNTYPGLLFLNQLELWAS